MHMDSVSNHTRTSEGDIPSISPPKRQTWRLLHIHLLLKVAMKKDILNVKLVEIPLISGSKGNKKPNKCHLSNRGKSVEIVHTIGLGISFSNKVGFQSSNGSI